MRVKTWVRALMMVPVLCLAGLNVNARQQSSSQQQTGDPVADAARKAREQKKNATKPKKVYTDDDVSKGTPGAGSSAGNSSGAPAGGATTAGAGSANAGGAPAQEDPNGEKAWRKKFQEQRDKIAKAERELDVLQRESVKAQMEYYPDPQKALTEQNSRKDINDKKAKMDAKQKELEQLRQGLSDMEDQLRKAGGDPGWAR